MVDQESWTSERLGTRFLERKGGLITLTRSAIKWTGKGEDLSVSLDAIATVGLEHSDDEGLYALCHILTQDGGEILILATEDKQQERAIYRDFVATLIRFLGRERCDRIAFVRGPIGSGRTTSAVLGVGCSMWLVVMLLAFIFVRLPDQTPDERIFGIVLVLIGMAVMGWIIYDQAIRKPPRFDPEAIPEHLLPELKP